MFSTDSKSIYAAVFRWLKISAMPLDYRAKLWHENINNISKFIQIHRNNVIKKLRGIAHCKYTKIDIEKYNLLTFLNYRRP